VLRSSSMTRSDTLVENLLPVAVGGVVFAAGRHIVNAGREQVDTTLVVENAAGCDSTIHYSLLVWRNRQTLLDSSVCNNQLPLKWNDITFPPIPDMAEASTRIDTTRMLTTINGADSLLYMHLTVHATYNHHDTVERCSGDLLQYGSLSFIVVADSAADLMLSSGSGCDSLIHLYVMVHPVYHLQDEDTICRNELPYMWLDTVINTVHGDPAASSIDSFTLSRASRYGCDSTHALHLVVHPVQNAYVEVTQCDGQEFTWEDGVTYYGTTYEPSVTYPNRYGCDSTLRLILNIVDGFSAAMRISPDMVSYESDEVRLDDISDSRRRTWYIEAYVDGGQHQPLYEDSSRTSRFTFPPDADSVSVLMVAYNAAGCRDSVGGRVLADRGTFWAPNAFTPGEGSNNRFNIAGNDLNSGEVWIYDRQGLYITHFTIGDEGWDGTYKEHPCPQGVYTWKLRYTTQTHPRQPKEALGTVVLIR